MAQARSERRTHPRAAFSFSSGREETQSRARSEDRDAWSWIASVCVICRARLALQVDEPFAWDAREYLRKLLVGKAVQFRQDSKSATGRARVTATSFLIRIHI